MLLETLPADRIDLRTADIPGDIIEALYVHIPFCFHKCHYCDFYSITKQTPQRMTRFVDLLLDEASLWSDHAVQPKTIFFGGGTPSLLPLDAMRRLIVGLRDRFDLSHVNEWTIEVNPATADLDYLSMLRELGLDRLSFGAQSFNRTELQTLERHHEPDDVPRSIDLARQAGFKRLNIDLIYAIPGQTIASWERSLDVALSLGLLHLSCYGLTYEPNTVIAVKKRLGQMIPQSDETELAMFKITRDRLGQAGLPWYEISNYARPGDACRHNLMYWSGANYVGLGPSAASHVSGHRFKNRPHLGEWENAVPSGSLPVIEHEHLTREQRIAERVMLSLRLCDGMNWNAVDADLRSIYRQPLEQLHRVGLIDVDAKGFRLTEKGLNVADGIASEFLI